MQLICGSLLPLRMSVTIIFFEPLTVHSYHYHSYFHYSLLIYRTTVTLPHVCFDELSSCQSADLPNSLAQCTKFQADIPLPFLNGFISGFQHNNLLFPGYKVIYNRKCSSIWKFQTLIIKCAQKQSITFILSTSIWNFVTKFSHKIFTSF